MNINDIISMCHKYVRGKYVLVFPDAELESFVKIQGYSYYKEEPINYRGVTLIGEFEHAVRQEVDRRLAAQKDKL